MSTLSKYITLLLVLFLGCVEPYPPPVSNTDVNYLVVDGFVNVSEGKASIRLSRAIPLSDESSSPPELNAEVTLVDDLENTLAISETGNGNYTASNLVLDHARQYKLYIRTTNGNEYESNMISPKTTPPIDSVVWRPTEDGVQIMVNTHDESGESRYYQWSFEETWEYTSAWQSSFMYNGENIVVRNEENDIYYCWKAQPSTQIIIGSSFRLSNDVINNFPLVFIPAGSQKIAKKYSILVRQNTLSSEAYDFWKQLEQTTENLGGLFDPQPGQVLSNVHSITNPPEIVLGFFNVGDVTSKRIFIKFSDLPAYLRFYYPQGGCRVDSVALEDLAAFDKGSNNLLGSIYQGPFLIGYTFTSIPCSDCRYGGGTTSPPDFWE